MERQKSQESQPILKKVNKVTGLTVPNVKPYYKTTVFETVWYYQKTRKIDHWDRIQRLWDIAFAQHHT